MGQKVIIIGDSGTGKSASIRNFSEDEILVINTANKPLPFKNHFECVTPSFERLSADILKAMDSTNKKVIVIDDAQYILSFPMMKRIKETGWDKWNDIQGDFFTIIKHCNDLPDDVIVYFLSHLQRTDDGHEKIKTVGKMLDEKITIEGLFTVVLKTAVNDGQYVFLTQNSGMDTVKSPIGMFDSYAIDNDLKYVDTKIRNYYEIGEFVDDETIKELDQAVAKESITKETAGNRRRRNRKTDDQETTEQKGSGTVDGQGTVPEPAPSTEGSTTEEKVSEESKRRSRPLETPEAKVDTPTETVDAPTEEPTKRRSRKDRNGKKEEEKPAEAPVEKAKEETGRKRRRRSAKSITEEDFMNVPDIDDEALPFI